MPTESPAEAMKLGPLLGSLTVAVLLLANGFIDAKDIERVAQPVEVNVRQPPTTNEKTSSRLAGRVLRVAFG
ncbi:hypothetical protein RBSWK_04462 [Rhodopirellula baltica SWK14]|uniref:Uncharacterized protein n=1 Tax=Rhodopirellula baltica SWK14 TaxID=993516 RepID=L7CBT2_RHOBT|nr:hypothetical protein RBSWK_04462 [Rhodopirellula baltica SWK14]